MRVVNKAGDIELLNKMLYNLLVYDLIYDKGSDTAERYAEMHYDPEPDLDNANGGMYARIDADYLNR